MEEVFKNFLNVYGCGIRGVSSGMPFCDEVLKLALNQQVLETVCVGYGWKVPQNVRLAALKRVGVNDNKMRKSYALIKLLEENGVNPCVLKGEAVASLYAVPECRISSDVDIYVGEALPKAEKLLSEAGFEIFEADRQNGHHTLCVHPVLGKIELHKMLTSPDIADMFFENENIITESYNTVKTRFGEIKTLGVTDNLLYILFHFIRHFVATCGIRQVADILTYMSCYKEEIDFERFWQTVRRLKYDGLVNIIIGVGKEYMGFGDDLPNVLYDVSLCDDFLESILKFSLFDKNVGRRNAETVFKKVRFGMFRSESYSSYKPKHSRHKVLKAIFPPKSDLKYRYRYAKKHSFLLPVAWVNWLADFVIKSFQGKMSLGRCLGETLDDIDKEKISLVKRLGMID